METSAPGLGTETILVVEDEKFGSRSGSGYLGIQRLLSRRPDMEVLYMSGYTDPVGGRLPRDSAYIQKPFANADLIQKVREILDTPGA